MKKLLVFKAEAEAAAEGIFTEEENLKEGIEIFADGINRISNIKFLISNQRQMIK